MRQKTFAIIQIKPLALAVAGLLSGTAGAAETLQMAEENVLVLAERVVVRNHVNDTAPKLVYDAAYFQRYEPISVGDMLKRVPGVTFNSDVGEYDLPRLRGLDSRYTQVLINGRPVPGSENDGAIAVDRIPAEMIKNIEIIRSPSADISSNGIGGTLNIVLKDGARYQGGAWRLGAVHMDQTRGSGYAGYSGSTGKVDYGFSVNVQERYNPKAKVSSEVDGDEREDVVESDVRDSRDLALDTDLAFNLDNGDRASLKLYYLDTDREEEEHTAVSVFVRDDELAPFVLDEDVNEHQLEEIEQHNLALSGDYEWDGTLANTVFSVAWQNFSEEKTETNSEADAGEPLALDDVETTDIDDTQLRLGMKTVYELGRYEGRYGAEYLVKTRDFALEVFDDEGELDDENDEFADFSADYNQLDVFMVNKWSLNDALELEAGLRAEYSELTIDGRDFAGAVTSEDETDLQINPAVHLRWNLGASDQIRASVARTLLRPRFDQLNPVELTIEDEKFRGNPTLEPEKSWGVDAGYEHFINHSAVVGFNLFYRQVTDLIEYTESEVVDADEAFDLRTPINNSNTGKVYGAELDISAPATWLGLSELQWFVNLTLLDSEVEDAFFEGYTRKFSGQADSVYNIGFEHELQPLQMSYGMSYQKQADSEEFEGGEINRISYDGNLELFVEKRFADGDYVVRLAGQNLLDAEKRELKQEYDDREALDAGTPDTRERELESTDAAIILTLRGRF